MRNQKLQNVIQLASANRAPAITSRLQLDVKVGAVGVGATSPGLVPFPRWQKARDRATAAILAGERRLVVTGPAGTGKTLLLEHVARTLRAAGWEADVRLADADPQPPHGTSAALLVDEADHLPREALQRLLQGTSGPLVLAGLEPLDGRVPGAARIALATLDREEARDYIAQWLALTGRTPAHLETAAVRRVVELSSGVPRLLSTLLAASAWLAESEGAPVISVQHVTDAAALRLCFAVWDDEPDAEPKIEAVGPEMGAEEIAAAPIARVRRVPAYVPALTAMLLFGVGGYLAPRIWPSETQQVLLRAQTYLAQLGAESRARFAGEPAPSTDPNLAAASIGQLAPPAAPPRAAPPSLLADASTASIADTPEPPAQIATPLTAEPPAPIPEVNAGEPVTSGPVTSGPVILAEPVGDGDGDAWTGPAEIAAAPLAPEPALPLPEAAAPAPSAPPDATEQAAATSPKPAMPAAAAPPAPRAELPAGLMQMLVKRGHDMLAIGDVSAARLLFSRAAEAGNVEAMLAMGRTFDPVILAGSSSLLTPDPAEAARWYRRAATAEAAALSQRIAPQAAR